MSRSSPQHRRMGLHHHQKQQHQLGEADLDLDRDLERDLDLERDFSLLAGERDREAFRSPFFFRSPDRERERLRDFSSLSFLPFRAWPLSRGDLLRDREALRSRGERLRERDRERDLDLERREPPALTRRMRLPLNSVSSSSLMARSTPSRDRNSTMPSPRRSRCASLNVTSPTVRIKSFKSCQEAWDDRFSTMRRCSVRSGGGRRLRCGEWRRKPGCRS